MSKDRTLDFVYSGDFRRVNDARFRGWCVHLICHGGEGSFVFNDKCFHLRRNDLAILTLPEQVCHPAPHPDMRVEFFAAPLWFLNSQLPANHFGVGGAISLYEDPVIPLSEEDACCFTADLHRLRDRMGEARHPFYRELMGSLCQTMMYDIFRFHSRHYGTLQSTDRRTYLVRELMRLLQTGICQTERRVSYYAALLHVSAKHLSDTVRLTTGSRVTSFIDRYTVPILRGLLEDDRLSLTQISDLMNFASLSYFSRYVSKHLGVTPTQYRMSLQPKKRQEMK